MNERVPGRWRKVQHKETKVQVDMLPEGGRLGTRSNLATAHMRYVEHFDRLVERAREQEDM
jgi:hypothetical protein